MNRRIEIEDEWKKEFKKRGILWLRSKDSKGPHALLSSGYHSDGYFDATEIVSNPVELEKVCRHLIKFYCFEKDRNGINGIGKESWVFGSAFGACNLSYEFGRQLGCKAGFTESDINGNMVLKRFSIKPRATIILVEDVVTTGDTILQTRDCLKKAGGHTSSNVIVICNRSGKTFIDGLSIMPLVNEPMYLWKPEECPLCKQGSIALRYKENREKFKIE